MVLLSEENLKIMNTYTLSLAKHYLRQGSLKRIAVNELEKKRIYQVEGTIHVSSYENHCHFYIDLVSGSIYHTHCECPWYFDDEHICAHIGMLMVYLTKVDIQSFPYVSIKEAVSYHQRMEEYLVHRKKVEEEMQARRLQESFQKTRNLIEEQKTTREYQIQLELQNQQYDIVPNFSGYDGHSFLLGFSVGAQKKYTIKNIREFLSWIQEERFHSYGKQLAFIHTRNAFSPQAQKYIEFMHIANNHQSEDLYYYRFNNTRYLHIRSLIPLFYDMFKDDPHVLIREEEFKLSLQIEKKDSYYQITMDWDKEVQILLSKMYLFSIQEQSFALIHYKVDPHSSIISLFDALSQGPLCIPFEEYHDFERFILNEAQEYLKICTGQELLPLSQIVQIQHPTIYGDLDENGALCFHATGTDENGNTLELLFNPDIASNIHLEIIQTILERAATWLDKENHCIYMGLESEKTIDFLENGIDQLNKYGDVFVSDALKRLGKKTTYKLQTGVKVDHGLLEVEIHSEDFDVQEIPSILQAYHRKKRYFRLKSGQLLHLESDELEELDTLLQDFDIDPKTIQRGKMTLELYRALGMNAQLDAVSHMHIQKDTSLTQYIQGFENRKSGLSIDSQYQSILRDYQKKGVEWLLMLYQYQLNGILADEMGLGKTLQVIALLDSIRSDDKHSLIVCPASLIYNWEDEIQRFSSTLSCISITGSKEQRKTKIKEFKKNDILITSYDYLRRDLDEYADLQFEYVVLDEAQNIKNQKTKNALSVKELQAFHRLALSGTPIENALAELWSIFDFLMPGYLFNYHYFKTQYESPIVLHQNEMASKKLRSFVSPFILRRTKKEVLKELPDKVDHQYLIDFSKEERKLYLAHLAQANQELQNKIKDDSLDSITVLALLTKLRQLCCDGRLLYDNIQKPSTKVQACIELIQILTEHNKKVLVFSAFTSLMDLLAHELDKNEISYFILTGSTSKEERRKLVHDFQNDQTQVFLISLKAGGTGLNLTAAEAVIHIDPWWNVSAQNQATDRAHRIGQNANVQVYRLIMKDSIEEKIVKMQERKKNLADTFIEGNDGSISKMSKEEIMKLFQRI